MFPVVTPPLAGPAPCCSSHGLINAKHDPLAHPWASVPLTGSSLPYLSLFLAETRGWDGASCIDVWGVLMAWQETLKADWWLKGLQKFDTPPLAWPCWPVPPPSLWCLQQPSRPKKAKVRQGEKWRAAHVMHLALYLFWSQEYREGLKE